MSERGRTRAVRRLAIDLSCLSQGGGSLLRRWDECSLARSLLSPKLVPCAVRQERCRDEATPEKDKQTHTFVVDDVVAERRLGGCDDVSLSSSTRRRGRGDASATEEKRTPHNTMSTIESEPRRSIAMEAVD